jgi:hypothetical protein
LAYPLFFGAERGEEKIGKEEKVVEQYAEQFYGRKAS